MANVKLINNASNLRKVKTSELQKYLLTMKEGEYITTIEDFSLIYTKQDGQLVQVTQVGGGGGDVTKQYVDDRDNAILQEAKDYADNQDYTTLTEANDYTDERIQSMQDSTSGSVMPSYIKGYTENGSSSVFILPVIPKFILQVQVLTDTSITILQDSDYSLSGANLTISTPTLVDGDRIKVLYGIEPIYYKPSPLEILTIVTSTTISDLANGTLQQNNLTQNTSFDFDLQEGCSISYRINIGSYTISFPLDMRKCNFPDTFLSDRLHIFVFTKVAGNIEAYYVGVME